MSKRGEFKIEGWPALLLIAWCGIGGIKLACEVIVALGTLGAR